MREEYNSKNGNGLAPENPIPKKKKFDPPLLPWGRARGGGSEMAAYPPKSTPKCWV